MCIGVEIWRKKKVYEGKKKYRMKKKWNNAYFLLKDSIKAHNY